MKAVVVGSDSHAANLATLAIRLRWPDTSLKVATSGGQGIALVESHLPDLVLLHWDLADSDLSRVIPEVRRFTMAPLVVLGRDDRQMELVNALTLGADEYVKLPCGITELTVRVWATYRRTSMGTIGHESPLRSGQLLLKLATREAFLGESALRLTPTEFRLLRKLVENKGSVVTHRSLETALWESRADGQELVKKYIQRLRQKLGDNARSPYWIASVHGVGYRFIGPTPTTKSDMPVPIFTEPAPESLMEVSA